MRNHFICPYSGNKRCEVEGIYSHLDLTNITTIIEPCCGSSALSYYISTLNPKKFTYILNDADAALIQIYEILRDPDKLREFETSINKMVDKFNECKTDAERVAMWNPLIHAKNHNNDVYSSFFIRKYSTVNGRMPPLIKNKLAIKHFKASDHPIYNFMRTENIILYNKMDVEIIQEYKDTADALIFLDPPYIKTNNDWYNNNDMNVYEYLFNNNISTFKCQIYLILEKIWIIQLLFKSNTILDEYSKQYMISKKKTGHIIITK